MEQDEKTIPQHVGYIVDGNRRWAKEHGLPAYEGHLAGYNALKDIVLDTFDAGVRYVSIYSFSTENWKRGDGEVGKLMKLALRVFKSDLHIFVDKQIRLKVLGVEDGLSDTLLRAMREAEEKTAHFTEKTVCICFNYGGQREIADAARKMIEEGTKPEDVTEAVFARHLYSPDVPSCDVIVRTSGEHRLSNFMLWRSAYSEFVFLDKLFPDMRKEDIYDIIATYNQRQRRYGS